MELCVEVHRWRSRMAVRYKRSNSLPIPVNLRAQPHDICAGSNFDS